MGVPSTYESTQRGRTFVTSNSLSTEHTGEPGRWPRYAAWHARAQPLAEECRRLKPTLDSYSGLPSAPLRCVLGYDMSPSPHAARKIGARRKRGSGLESVLSCQSPVVSDDQKTHPAKIRPDGAPASRLLVVGKAAGWATRLGYPLPPSPHAARKTSARRRRGSGLEHWHERQSGLSQHGIVSPAQLEGGLSGMADTRLRFKE
jgi:hypothetical protein